jgi:hypothetical protein
MMLLTRHLGPLIEIGGSNMRTDIAEIDNRACYSGFDEDRVSTPSSTERTYVHSFAGPASRCSGDMQEAAE